MNMANFQYQKNIYLCENCGHRTITVDRDLGVTPFTTGCPKCKGTTVSNMYRVPQHLTPTHEWYRPNDDEMQKVLQGKPFHQRQHIIQHVKQGGLLLREIDYDINKVLAVRPRV